MDTKDFLETAIEAIKKAEPIFRQSFGLASGIVKKNDISRSPVTDADKKIEEIITSHITRCFPEHSIIGEEFPAQKNDSPYTWFIDPIDGTTNYIHGLSPASISLALWKNNAPLISAVSDPMNNIIYTAILKNGAYKNGNEKLSVSKTPILKESFGTIGRTSTLATHQFLQSIAQNIYRGRVMGGSALELCYIAEGKLDFQISERIKTFDVAAGMLILTEAGGIATDWIGNAFTEDSSQIVSSNGVIHQELLALLH